MTQIEDCKLVELTKIHNPAGNITVINNNKELDFTVKRIYYIYNIPGGESRGGHAHKNLYQLVVAASGSFDLIIDDGNKKKEVFLNHPNKGLLIVPGIWREIVNFSSGAICLVLASEKYNENDYIRNYKEFLKYTSE
jgi:dTDP-4-dehydrorhamnose 3,5-epimerase-like enzyme